MKIKNWLKINWVGVVKNENNLSAHGTLKSATVFQEQFGELSWD